MQSSNNSMLQNFRVIAFIEGISYIILMFIAMPLKYFGGLPLAVTYTGWVHGILFMAYLLLLINVAVKYSWSFKKIAWAFVAGLIPFGTFFLDKQLKADLQTQK